MNKKQRKQNAITILVGAIISCFIGFYNKYPLVYSDTGTYLASGFSGDVPNDRSLFYGLFMRHISLSATPWLIILVQGLIVSWLLHMTIGIFFKETKRNVVFLGAITFITLTTGFSHNVSMLLPDIFCTIALLCAINLLFNNDLRKWSIVVVSIIFVFSLSTHLSNIPTFGLLFTFLLVNTLIRRKRKKETVLSLRKIALPIYLFVFALILIPSVHFAIGGKFQFSSGSHVFMVNHLIECGIMEDYLQENCERSNYKLCEYKDSLTWNFMWDENSPLYKTGGWHENKLEYKQMLREIYTTPKYWPLLTQKSIEYTVKQFFTFETSGYSPYLSGSAPFGQIDWRFHDSTREYLSSKQNANELNTKTLNQLEIVVILFSLLIIFAYAYYPTNTPKNQTLKWLIFVVLLYGILNSGVCANLATIDARFQNRWIWMMPVLAIIAALSLLKDANRIKCLMQSEKGSTP